MRDEETRVSASAAETLIRDATGLGALAHDHTLSADGGQVADRRGQWGWTLFEAARDPNILFQIYIISPFFATTMIRDAVWGQELWGEITTWSGVIVAICAPFMGAIADRGGPRKPWLALFAAAMVVSFAGTWFGVAGATPAVVALVGAMVVINNVTFEFSNAFHGAMLSGIAPLSRIGGLSGLAYALGNASGVILLVFFLVAFMLPGKVDWSFIPAHPLFGVNQALHEPERLAGPVSALWMLLLAVPLFLYTPDRAHRGLPFAQVIEGGVRSVWHTVLSLPHYRNVAHYLGARCLFNDGMTGVLTFSGIYAAGIFGFGALEMTAFGIIISVFAALGGLLGGWLDDRMGSRRALFLSIGGTTLFFSLALTMAPDRIFWFWHASTVPSLPLPFFSTWPRFIYLLLSDAMAMSIVAGYANSRTMMARIAPPAKMTEFFGLMSLSGSATTFLAPVSVTLMTGLTHSQRGGMVAVAGLLAAGLVWLTVVKEERATAA